MATAVDANHQAVVLARQHARFSRRLSPVVRPDAGPRRYHQPGGWPRMRRRPDQMRGCPARHRALCTRCHDRARTRIRGVAGSCNPVEAGKRRLERATEPRLLAQHCLGIRLQPAAQPTDHLGAAAFIMQISGHDRRRKTRKSRPDSPYAKAHRAGQYPHSRKPKMEPKSGLTKTDTLRITAAISLGSNGNGRSFNARSAFDP